MSSTITKLMLGQGADFLAYKFITKLKKLIIEKEEITLKNKN